MKTQAAFNRLPAGRADLVRALVCCGEDGLECAAASLGFHKIEPVLAKNDRQDNQHGLSGQAFIPSPQGDTSPPETPGKNRPIGRFYRMVEYQELDKTEYQRAHDAIEQAKPLTEEELNAEPKIQPPKPLPLIPWRRMWPFLRRILGAQRDRRQLDVAKVVKSLSSGHVLTRIPFEQKKYWAPSCQILVEINARNLPFRCDYAELVGKLMQMRGCMGLDIVVVDQGPSSLIYPGLGAQGRYKQPAAGTPVLIISDLGYYDDSGRQTRAWSRFLTALNRGGLRPVALTPTPPRFWPQDLSAWVTPFSWDRGNRLLSPNRPSGSHESATDLNRLLELLAPSVRVEAALLRAIRYLLPKDQLDVASESAAWANPDVMATLNGFQIKPDRKQIYRDAFLKLDDAGLKQCACESLMAYHRHLAPEIVAEEALNCRELAGIKIEDSELRSWRVVKTFEPGRHTPVGMVPWFGRLVARQSSDSWTQNPAWEAAWYWWNEEMKQAGKPQSAPDGLNAARAAALVLPPQDIVRYRFDQCGENLVMTPGTSGEASSESEKQKSYLGFIQASTPIMSWVLQMADSDANESGVIDLSEANTTGPNLPRGGRLTLSSDIEKCVLDDWLTKPKWASGVGRDRYGLFADFKLKSITQRLRWINPGRFMMGSPPDEPERFDNEVQHEVTLTQGYWLADTACTQALWLAVMGKNPSEFAGEQRPVEWVSYVDIEKFIEEINLQIDGLNLRLPTEAEWEYACRAGTETPFSFGDALTPDQANYDRNYFFTNEEELYVLRRIFVSNNNERQQIVQQFEAEFKSKKKARVVLIVISNNTLENSTIAGFNDAGQFKSLLIEDPSNELSVELKKEPANEIKIVELVISSLGRTRKKRGYQGQTVDVKYLNSNSWGLFQMHGNVREWCSDWCGDFSAEPAVDPEESDVGDYRVLRGGSGYSEGCYVRSASRRSEVPSYLGRDVGFRLARGSMGKTSS